MILGERVSEVNIELSGSFAMTYRGHGTDRALIAGILGMKPDDDRIINSFDIARYEGLKYRFSETILAKAHPNTAILHLTGVYGAHCSIQGASVGGGSILIAKLNGMESVFNGEADTLIVVHKDTPGVIAAVTSLLAESGLNIGNFRSSRSYKGRQAIMIIETDSAIDESVVTRLRSIPEVINVVYMPPVI